VWVVIRSARKLVRYLHLLYLDMGYRNEVMPFEWFCVTFLTFSFPLEYLTSLLIVLVTYPVARYSDCMELQLHPKIVIDLSFSYWILLFMSIPYFFSTLVYSFRKRSQVLSSEARACHLHRSDSISEED